MMQRPWAPGTIDEWLPRNLRLCWGDSGDSGGGMGGGGFGGGGDSGGFGGPGTGGGDWGSAGAYDASGMQGYADPASYAAALAASPGGFYDTGGRGIAEGALGAEFGGTLGLSGISGQPGSPSGAFGAELDAGGGGTSGIGNALASWGQTTAAGGPGAGTGAAYALSGGMVGDFGGGTGGGYGGGGGYTDYAGGGGGYTGGGGGRSGGGTGGGGGRGGGGSFGSFGAGVGRGGASDETGIGAPGGSSGTYGAGIGRGGASDETGATPSEGPEAPEATPEVTPEATPEFGAPEAAPEVISSKTAPESTPEATPESRSTTTQEDQPTATPEVTQTELSPQDVNWGSVFEAPAQSPQDVGRWSDLPSVYSTGISNLLSQAPGWLSQAQENPAAQNYISANPISNISTWLSPQNQQTFNQITSLPSTLYSALNPSVPTMLQAPSTMDLQALGEQGRAGQPDIGTQGIDPGTAQYATAPDPASQLGINNVSSVDWGSVFEGAAPAPSEPDWSSVFEGAPSNQNVDWGSVFEGAAPVPTETQTTPVEVVSARDLPANTPNPLAAETAQPEWGSVFEGAAAPGAAPGPDTTMESGQPGQQTSTDTTATIGGDPALSGAPVDAANAAATAAQTVGAPQAADSAAQAAAQAALNGASPVEQATAAMGAALEAGATQAQADAIAGSVYDAAVSQTTPAPSATPAPSQQAPFGPEPASEPTGTQAVIPGGRTTDFNYTPSSTPPTVTALPPAAPAPGLLDMQPGVPMPQARPAEAPQPGQQGGIGSDYAAGDAANLADHNTPEPADSSLPAGDPNAPRPPGNIPAQPGQLLGARGTYQNQQADNPQTNRNYRDSGRTDYPQGRPGVNFRTARQAGIEPHFRTEDINTGDLDSRLVERLNRAIEDMPPGIRDTLVASSGFRAAHRGEALEHMMDPRTSQESVYSRGHPSSGRGFPSAQPGNSNHGHGRAIDFNSSPALSWLRSHAGQYGLETIPGDHPHIQLQGARGNVGQRPSAAEQAEQRSIDAQNRQAAIDQGLIGGGRAQNQQARSPAAPQGRQGGLDPGAEQYGVTPSPVMIGLKGKGGAFDAQAFNDHAAQLGYRGVVVNSPQEARDIIDKATGKVGLYGFSAGANTAHSLLGQKGVKDKVDQVVTVAPFHGSQTQNFKGTNWDNYPDYSSRGIDPQGRGFAIQTRQHTKEAQREAAGGRSVPGTQQPDVSGGINPGAEQFGTFPAAVPPAANLPPQDRPPADIPAPAPAPAPAPITVGKALAPLFGKLPGDQAKQVSEGLGKLSEKAQADLLTKGPAAIVAELARQGGRDPTTVQNWLNGSYAMFGYPGYPGGYAQFAKDVAAAQAAYAKSLPHKAEGGHVAKDEPVVVGEQGPETFVPDQPGTVFPHMPQPDSQPGNIDRWPKGPAIGYPGQYGGVEREIRRQTRAAQNPSPGLMDMIDSGRLRLNAANWQRMITDPDLIALGRSRIEDRR